MRQSRGSTDQTQRPAASDPPLAIATRCLAIQRRPSDQGRSQTQPDRVEKNVAWPLSHATGSEACCAWQTRPTAAVSAADAPSPEISISRPDSSPSDHRAGACSACERAQRIERWRSKRLTATFGSTAFARAAITTENEHMSALSSGFASSNKLHRKTISLQMVSRPCQCKLIRYRYRRCRHNLDLRGFRPRKGHQAWDAIALSLYCVCCDRAWPASCAPSG